jgi:DNA invertase Pin-like site-specific DNA recombinase
MARRALANARSVCWSAVTTLSNARAEAFFASTCGDPCIGCGLAAGSIGDLQDIVRTIRAKGATLRATEQPIDTSTAAGKAFLDMLGVFAEFETNLRRERQLEGIAAAKAKGVYKGRPASIDAAQISALRADGLGPTEIAKRLGVARASVYRVLEARPLAS